MDASNTLPLDLGWDDCSVGLLTGCQGGYTEHTDSAFLRMWELLCVLRSPNNSCALRGRENKHKTVLLLAPNVTLAQVNSGVFWDPVANFGA